MSSPADVSWDRLQHLLRVLAETLLLRIPELRRRVGASDLVQEAMLKASQAWEQLRDRSPGGIKAWLRTILRNEFKDAIAFALRDVRNLDLEKSIDQEIDNSSLRLERFLEHRAAQGLDAALDLAAALDRLAPEDRDIVIAHDLEKRSLRDIAEEVGFSKNKVAARLAQAHGQLRRWLCEYETEPEGGAP